MKKVTDVEGVMAGGWQDLADTLNKEFDTNLNGLATDFKNKHGNNGNGGGGKTPYKFGHFAHKNPKAGLSERANSRFLMDSGTRHWGGDKAGDPRAASPELLNLEDVVKFSLTNSPPKKMKFKVETDPAATYATASVTGHLTAGGTVSITAGATDPNLTNAVDWFDVLIKCPPGVNR